MLNVKLFIFAISSKMINLLCIFLSQHLDPTPWYISEELRHNVAPLELYLGMGTAANETEATYIESERENLDNQALTFE